MPRSFNAVAGPMPARIRKAGEWMPPSATMISPAKNSLCSPSIMTRTPAVEQQSDGESVGYDGEIAATACGSVEVANRRRRPSQRPIAHRDRAIAVAKIAVHIGDEWDLPFLRENMHCLGERR